MFNSQHRVVHEVGAFFHGLALHQPKSAISQECTPMSDNQPAPTGRAPQSEPAADKPSETKAFPQPPSAPLNGGGTRPTRQRVPACRHPSRLAAADRRVLP